MCQQHNQQEQEQATSGLEVDVMADSKKYDGSQWEHSLRKLTTATEAVENPLYSDGTAITSYTIKGNTVQNGTPTPNHPLPVVGVGELETTGEHTGGYKIPISSAGVTTNIYLGSTQTTRRIKKLVLTGEEDLDLTSLDSNRTVCRLGVRDCADVVGYCTHINWKSAYEDQEYNRIVFNNYLDGSLYISLENNILGGQTVYAFKAYLAAQYAAGTPVTVWYVLATAETAAVNEPLMKIGDYADILSNATAIPTTDGANSITVDTIVQPSEFTATWTGWHNINVKEWNGSDWS